MAAADRFICWQNDLMMIKPLDYFTMLVKQDDSIPLFEAALSIAQEPGSQLDFNAAFAAIDTFAATLQQRLPAYSADIQKLRTLNQFFYRDLGFSGNANHYYDPDNSFLPHVIHTRRGIPISLAVVYMELAQQIDLNVKGVAFPGHFLMKLSLQAGDVIIDPLNGVSLSREELEERLLPYLASQDQPIEKMLASHLQAAHPRQILVRMLRNLKAIYVEGKCWRQLLGVQQRLAVLLPNDITEQRDRGLAYANQALPQLAVIDIEAYLAQRPYAADAALLREKLPELRKAIKRIE